MGVVPHDASVRPVVAQRDLLSDLPEAAAAVQTAGREADRKRLAEGHRDLPEGRHLQIHARPLPRDPVSGRCAAARHGRGEGAFPLAVRRIPTGARGASLGHHAEDVPRASPPPDGNRSAGSGIPSGRYAGKRPYRARPAVSAVGAVRKRNQHAPFATRADAQPSERRDRSDARPETVPGREAARPVSERRQPRQAHGGRTSAPAHDERDWDFAKKFNLPIIKVVATKEEIASLADGDEKKGAELLREAAKNPDEYKKLVASHPDVFGIASECTSAKDGYAINSEQFTGLPTKETIPGMIKWLGEKGIGKKAINYKLRDWVFSRQRYWGEPIPLVHCPKCGTVPVPESELPLELPNVKTYQPTGTGESPLAGIDEWVNCKCPVCGEDAKRETNTMPQWAGSCWYYLRYLDAVNDKVFADKKAIEYWMPVDLYVGGAEHAVLHLLYSRFWHKVLFDLGVVNTKEPFQRLINQGMITSFAYQRQNKTLVPTDEVEEKEPGVFVEKATGEKLEQVVAKMSKSLKNVVNPDEEIKKYGADSVRMYEMFMGPLTMSKPWSTQGIVGIHRFLEKVWTVSEKPLCDIDITGSISDPALQETRKVFAKTVQKVTEDTASLNFNTAISQMMIFINTVAKLNEIPRAMWSDFVKLLSVYAPHLGEELWEKLGNTNTIAYEKWPSFDEKFAADDKKTIVVMINGKLRDKFEAAPDTNEEELKKLAFDTDGAKKFMEGKSIVKVVCVPNKLVNIVVK